MTSRTDPPLPISALRRGPRAAVLLLTAVLVMTLASCASDDDDGSAGPTQSPEATGPYVSVAVDNHFHDIHRDDDIEIASDRAFIVKNEGRNLHNFTVVGTEIAEDVEPGEQFELDPIGDTLEPGEYRVVCRYHDSQGMVGGFIVTP